jgi:alkaline phosphatase D
LLSVRARLLSRYPMVRRWHLVAALVVLAGAAPAGSAPAAVPAPIVTHGVVVGDVSARSAVVWARADGEATMHVRLSGRRQGAIESVDVSEEDDFTGQVQIDGLRPRTLYHYRVWFSRVADGADHGPAVEGSFETAPSEHRPAPVRLAFGGDVAGQNVCRDAAEGFPIMDTIRGSDPDLFVGLGDMIYADNGCEPTGRYGNPQLAGPGIATDLPGFWAHWRYNRADPPSQRLLRSTSYVGVWDDHEVVNDFGPLTDAPTTPPYTGVDLLPLGLTAFRDYTPLAGHELYRSLRWGRHLELFVLDTRSYRDANFEADTGPDPKTMLGEEQLAWLKKSLAASDATWRVIVSSVPMSIPTGFPATNGRDGWANFDQQTGFERELLDILRYMADHTIENTVWITTDVHFAEAFRYRPFADRPSFVVHELATGPLNAGVFPNRAFDETLNPERLFFFGPATPEAVTSWVEAKRWFNFGTLEVAENGTLTAAIVDTAGARQYALELSPS